MNETARNYESLMPDIHEALLNVHQTLIGQDFERGLHHLIQLRASQMNRCGFCIDMHTREARWDGETNERLDRLAAFEQFADFSEREKAALTWTEALTRLAPNTDWPGLRTRVREHFTDKELAILSAGIAMINLWNRINISQHEHA